MISRSDIRTNPERRALDAAESMRRHTAAAAQRQLTVLALVFAVLFGGLWGAERFRAPAGAIALSRSDARLRIDPNTATVAELLLLPGVGPAIAAKIIDFRDKSAIKPAFSRLQDLDAVHGVGTVRLERWRDMLRFPAE
jgi:DNA uptake protein ComE-like DNA-binding protein